MNFSIRNLLIVIAVFSLVMGLAFGIGGIIGYLGLLFLSLYVFPPFLWVAVFNTTGIQRSFFLGVMVGGVIHFVGNVSLAWSVAMTVVSEGWTFFLPDAVTNEEYTQLLHLQVVAILLSLFGGFVGMLSHWMLGQRQSSE